MLVDRVNAILDSMTALEVENLLGAWILAGSIARPVEKLRSAAGRLGRGELDARVEPEGPQEIDELSRRIGVRHVQIRSRQRHRIASRAGRAQAGAVCLASFGSDCDAELDRIEAALSPRGSGARAEAPAGAAAEPQRAS